MLHRNMLRPEVKVTEHNGVYVHAGWRPVGVTDQFLMNADIYHDNYSNRTDFVDLVDQMLAAAQVSRSNIRRVLDIGSGGGSSVFALARLLPSAQIMASDISPNLLEKIIQFATTRKELKERIEAYCFDLHDPFFAEGVFDLIIGCAILHHLVDPFAALKNVIRSLRPDGKLVLVEPMEGGSLLLCSMFEAILETLILNGDEEGKIGKLMKAMRTDIFARLGVPQKKPWTEALDDKWVFDRPYLISLAKDLHCQKVEVYPAQTDLTKIFTQNFNNLLQVTGIEKENLPPELLNILDQFDSGIAQNIKKFLLPTAIIVFSS